MGQWSSGGSSFLSPVSSAIHAGQSGEHRVLNFTGKGGKERTSPLHLEAVERLNIWLAHPGIADDPAGPMFPASKTGFR